MSFDFIDHCKFCPSSTTHCCTKKGNIVLINDSEKDKIELLFEQLKSELNINDDTYQLFNNSETKNGVTPLNLIQEEDPDTNEKIERCPFFKKPYCTIHTKGKPLDCKLWPVAKFENGDRGKVYVDINCSAINAKEHIPTTTIEESVALFNSLKKDQKDAYYSQSDTHYTLKPVPVKIWDEFQNFKEIYKTKLDNAVEEINKDLERVESKFVGIDFHSDEVLYITKWIVGIFFASIFVALINQSVGNVEGFKIESLDYINHYIDFFSFDVFFSALFRVLIISFFTIVFTFDTYRIIIPLPWIIKDYSEKPFDFEPLRSKFENKNLPTYQVTKFAVIGILSFFLLNVMAIKFVYEPVNYLAIYGVIMALDLCWYYVNKKRLQTFLHYFKIALPIMFVLMMCAVSQITLIFPLLFSVFFLICFIIANYILPQKEFPLDLTKARMIARAINSVYLYFVLPSVEDEKDRIKNKIQTRCSDAIFREEEEGLEQYAKNNNQSVDSVIDIFKHEKAKLIQLKEGKLNDLNQKIDVAQNCEKYIDDREKELADELYFKLIARFDFVLCITPPLLIHLNEHYTHAAVITDNKYIILSISFFTHTAVMFFELFKNNFYKDYLVNLYIKSSRSRND